MGNLIKFNRRIKQNVAKKQLIVMTTYFSYSVFGAKEIIYMINFAVLSFINMLLNHAVFDKVLYGNIVISRVLSSL